jgi:pimeloyl-ACP methyl ester carboxylesterase
VLPLDALAGERFPKLAITGGWETASAATRATTGAALKAVSQAIGQRIGARQAVIPGALHTPHMGRPAVFNAHLRAFLATASGRSAAGVSDRDPGP